MKRPLALLISLVFLTFSVMLAGEREKTVLRVKGIHCSSCIQIIKKRVEKVDGIEETSVSLTTGEVTVLFDPAKKPFENVLKAIQKLGYKVLDNDSSLANSKGCCKKEADD